MKASNISSMVRFAVGGSAFRGRPLFLIRLPPTVILNRAGRFFLSLLPLRSNISTLPQRGRPARCEDCFLFARFLREGSLFGFKVFDEGCPMKAPA